MSRRHGPGAVLGPRARGALAALPPLAVAAGYVAVWVQPTLTVAGFGGPGMLRFAVFLVAFEFAAVVALLMLTLALTGELPLRAARWQQLAAAIGIPVALAFGFALAFGEGWYFLGFFGLLAVKAAGLRLDPPGGEARELVMSRAGTSLLAFLFAAFTIVLPWPPLGVTPELAAAAGFPEGSSGALVDAPWRALAFGAIYYALQAFFEFQLHVGPEKWRVRVVRGAAPPDP